MSFKLCFEPSSNELLALEKKLTLSWKICNKSWKHRNWMELRKFEIDSRSDLKTSLQNTFHISSLSKIVCHRPSMTKKKREEENWKINNKFCVVLHSTQIRCMLEKYRKISPQLLLDTRKTISHAPRWTSQGGRNEEFTLILHVRKSFDRFQLQL